MKLTLDEIILVVNLYRTHLDGNGGYIFNPIPTTRGYMIIAKLNMTRTFTSQAFVDHFLDGVSLKVDVYQKLKAQAGDRNTVFHERIVKLTHYLTLLKIGDNND